MLWSRRRATVGCPQGRPVTIRSNESSKQLIIRARKAKLREVMSLRCASNAGTPAATASPSTTRLMTNSQTFSDAPNSQMAAAEARAPVVISVRGAIVSARTPTEPTRQAPRQTKWPRAFQQVPCQGEYRDSRESARYRPTRTPLAPPAMPRSALAAISTYSRVTHSRTFRIRWRLNARNSSGGNPRRSEHEAAG